MPENANVNKQYNARQSQWRWIILITCFSWQKFKVDPSNWHDGFGNKIKHNRPGEHQQFYTDGLWFRKWLAEPIFYSRYRFSFEIDYKFSQPRWEPDFHWQSCWIKHTLESLIFQNDTFRWSRQHTFSNRFIFLYGLKPVKLLVWHLVRHADK